MGSEELSETEAQVFLRIIREMPARMVYGLTHTYDIDVPFELGLNEIPEYLFDELDADVRREIIDDYADAGKALCYFFCLDEKVPNFEQLSNRSQAIVSLKREGTFENVPYFERIEIHAPTARARIFLESLALCLCGMQELERSHKSLGNQ